MHFQSCIPKISAHKDSLREMWDKQEMQNSCSFISLAITHLILQKYIFWAISVDSCCWVSQLIHAAGYDGVLAQITGVYPFVISKRENCGWKRVIEQAATVSTATVMLGQYYGGVLTLCFFFFTPVLLLLRITATEWVPVHDVMIIFLVHTTSYRGDRQ